MTAIPTESINPLLEIMAQKDASDLHLQVGSPPVMRINGTPQFLTEYDVISKLHLTDLIHRLVNDKQLAKLDQTGNVDFAMNLLGLSRFRLNVFKQKGTLALVARRVPSEISTMQDLHLPKAIEAITDYQDGFVIVSGVTGSGKSTTLAAMIEHINQTRACHIITLEDPIETMFTNKKAYITQRELGIDVFNFRDALRAALRQDPDVILIGEMRDEETIELGLRAAETGHLVFGTLHSAAIPQTITRLLDLFPPEKQAQVRSSLAINLKSIICQKLLPAIDPNVARIPAIEILLDHPSNQKLIKAEQDLKLYTIVENNAKEGMQTFNQSLLKLVDEKLIEKEIALQYSPNPDELKMNLEGIFLPKGGLVGGS